MRLGVAAACVIALVVVLCAIAVPVGLGSSSDEAGAPPRYAATDVETALLPPWWTPHRDDERERVEQRGSRAWLGTDRLGRDLLIRCLLGGAISLGIGIAAAAIAVVIGTVYGTLAGLAGGRVDAVMMRIVDIMYGLPTVLLVVLLAVASDGLIERADAAVVESGGEASALMRFVESNPAIVNVVTLLVAIGSVSWLTMARVIRGEVMALEKRPFMEAMRVMGASRSRRLLRHLLPNMAGPIIVYATLAVPAAILSESFLSFLGIGVREPLPSWGNLAADGLSELNVVRSRWWLLAWPCVLIALTLLALNLLGEAWRARVDPTARRAA